MAFPTQSVLLTASSSQYYTRTDTTSLSITGDLTIECLFKLTNAFSAGERQWIVRKMANDGSTPSYIFNLQESGGNMRLYMRVDSATSQSTDKIANLGTFNTGTWYHLAGVFDADAVGAKITLYKDASDLGSVADNNAASSIRDSTDDLRIGIGGTGFEEYLDGRLSMMRVWSATRTSGQLNNCTILGATANLAAEWTFDNTANDNSGNSNTLTPVNTPTYAADVSSICVGGPAGMATFNGLAVASIATINGLATGSIA